MIIGTILGLLVGLMIIVMCLGMIGIIDNVINVFKNTYN